MANVEEVLVGWAQDRFPAARFCTEFPADVTNLPICRIVRIGGSRLHVLEQPTVAVDWLAATRLAAQTVAGEFEHVLYWELPGQSVGGAVIGHTDVISGPSWAPWDNTDVRRMTATYRLYLKDNPS